MNNEVKTINGYNIKDETARNGINTLKLDTNTVKYIFPKSHTNTGDYNIIQVDGKNILIDCYNYNDWQEVKSVLDDYNINHIDIFICSHFHSDHIGNFNNLVTNGYINQDTIIYFPKYTINLWSSDSSYTSEHGYLEAINTISQNNLTTIEPTEAMEVVLNPTTKFTFYNTDDEVSYETFTQENKYNNASLIVVFKHNDTYSIYWGDCYNQPVEWLYNLGLIPENIALWKMGHHGIDYTSQSYFHTIRKLKINYAIQEMGRDVLDDGHGYSNGNSSSFEKLGVPVLISAYNDENIEFESSKNNINLIHGNDCITGEKSRYKYITYYVDSSNYDYSKQDGGQDYPFSNLNQCLGNIDRSNGCIYTININEGDYNNEFVSYDEGKDISTLYGVTNKVIIQGDSSDNTKVVLHHGFNITDCSNIIIRDISISNGGTTNGFEIENSNVKISNVNYETDSENTNNTIGISTNYSNVYIDECNIDNVVHGIKSKYSKLVMNNIEMSNLTYQGINLTKSIVQCNNCSVTDDSANLITNDDNNLKSTFLSGISLWSGSKSYDSETSANNTFTLNSRVDKFNELEIKYITDTNKYKSVIVPVSSNNMNTSLTSSNIDSSNYLYNQQLSVTFNGTSVTISSPYRYKQNMSDPTQTPISSTSNITITEILGL